MKAHPSIAFNALSGTAGEVTARTTKNGTVLSSRAKHSRIFTPAQKTERAILSKIVRTYRTLDAGQMAAWAIFARNFRAGTNRRTAATVNGTVNGSSTVITASPSASSSPAAESYRLTGFHVFVRHNCNRALLGLDPITYPPTQVIYVSQVIFTYMCVTPDLIQFEGIESPGPTYRLAVGMSRATSAGVSYGGGRCVLIDPDFSPDDGVADLTSIYTDRFGIIPVVGQKYFVTTYWIERNTGFTGPRTILSRICMAVPPNAQ